jgi:glycerol-3-phosphate acyltransferase PlsY
MDGFENALIGIAAVVGLPDWKTVIAFWPYFAWATVGAYIAGSIPFGLLLTRAAGQQDIRKIGSGNIGATNVLRSGSKVLAAVTVILDAAKGTAAVWVAGEFGGGPDVAFFAAIAVVLGHVFPIWLGFRGGKGVATTFGVLLGVSWPVGVIAILIWLAAAILFRLSSLAALLSTAASPMISWLILTRPQAVTLAVILALLVWGRHAGNINRLLRGTETKIKLR